VAFDTSGALKSSDDSKSLKPLAAASASQACNGAHQ
jgi:hypothetical protein